MAGLGDLFGKGSIAEQFLLWNVLSQLSQGLLAPVTQAITNSTWSVDPNMPLSAELAADMVVRGKIVLGQGEEIAAKSGIGSANFAHLVAAAKHAPPFEVIVEGVRRKLIGAFSGDGGGEDFIIALQEMGIDERWWNLMGEMVINKPTGEAALNALLQGQITRERAYALWLQAGEDPDWFQDAFNSQGTAPTPVELGIMANRRLIPWDGTGADRVSFMQGFLEGPWRNKWQVAMRGLAEYLPPARTVTALVHEGSITDRQALALWEKEGLSPELAAAYLKSAHHTATATHKDLARSDIIALYEQKLVTEVEASKLLQQLNYTAEVASLMLKVADSHRAHAAVNSAVSRLRTLYTGRKITKAATLDALHNLGVPATETSELLQIWDIQAAANVRQLTEGQIVSAFDKEILTQDEASAELTAIGYTPLDAWILLSTRYGEPLPKKPAKGAGGIGVLP